MTNTSLSVEEVTDPCLARPYQLIANNCRDDFFFIVDFLAFLHV